MSSAPPSEGQPAVAAFRSANFPVSPTTFYTYEGRIANTLHAYDTGNYGRHLHVNDTRLWKCSGVSESLLGVHMYVAALLFVNAKKRTNLLCRNGIWHRGTPHFQNVRDNINWTWSLSSHCITESVHMKVAASKASNFR